jgi:splicing factor 3A subunit 2
VCTNFNRVSFFSRGVPPVLLASPLPAFSAARMTSRAGGKTGTGGMASAQQEALHRRERQRKLALETMDIARDPYFVRNNTGQYECKLCLTVHTTEASYLSHTQAKRHQQNLGRRAAREAAAAAALAPAPDAAAAAAAAAAGAKRKALCIGRPGYRVVKQRDAASGARSLRFEVEYPEIGEGLQPRHRFMSAFEQRVEQPPDRAWQYLLFAAEPYETVAFKIPSLEVERDPRRLVTHWDAERRVFTVRGSSSSSERARAPGRARPAHSHVSPFSHSHTHTHTHTCARAPAHAPTRSSS